MLGLNWEKYETKMLEYSLRILISLLEDENPKCKAIIQNKPELFELIFGDLNMIRKSDQNLPNSTLNFLAAVLSSKIEILIDTLLNTTDFFGIMREEITKYDFRKTQFCNLSTWLEMVARALKFGETIKCVHLFLLKSILDSSVCSLVIKDKRFWRKSRGLEQMRRLKEVGNY